MALSPAADLPATLEPVRPGGDELGLSPGELEPPASAAGRPPAAPALTTRQAVAIAAASSGVVAILLALQVIAVLDRYAVRVISDSPTYLALVRDLARHPLAPDSVFFGTADTRSMHASPYLQALALIWRALAPGGTLGDPLAVGTFLGIVAIPVTLFTLAMVWRFTREFADRTAAFMSVPAVLLAFGPAHIIFASDLTLNGFLDTGFYPTTFATGTLLGALIAVRRRTWPASLLAVLLTAATISSDLLAGAVLLVLVTVTAAIAAQGTAREGLRISLVAVAGLLLCCLWPVFNLAGAFADTGLPLPALAVAVLAAPQLWRVARRRVPFVGRGLAWLVQRPTSAASEWRIAAFGLYATAMLAIWGIFAIRHWPANHLLLTYRLGFYWNDQRDRWLLLLLPGVAGLIALVRLARRGRPELLVWFAGFFAIGVIGAAVHLSTGHQIPFYYRFILVCQVPLAVGLAVFLRHHQSPRAAGLVVATLSLALVFKAGTLLAVPTDESYFGSPLPSVWSLGAVIPAHSGVVAADPSTAYFVPAATDNRVFTMSMGHADSGQEKERADAGYRVLRALYVGDAAQAAAALRTMWSAGVRWVIAEKYTTMTPVDLAHLYHGPYDGVISRADVGDGDQYMSRLAAVGTQVYNDDEFSVFRLSPARVAAALAVSRGFSAADRSRVALLLATLADSTAAADRTRAGDLATLGVRLITFELGALGASPRLVAYGRSMATPVVSIDVPDRRWRCQNLCTGRDLSAFTSMGTVIHADPRFSVTVRLRAN